MSINDALKNKNAKKSSPKQKMSEYDCKCFDITYRTMQDILGYERTSLARDKVLRLKGITRGQFIANNSCNTEAVFSHEDLMKTIIEYKDAIKKGIERNRIEDDVHKFLYACKVIESNIDRVSERSKKYKALQNQPKKENDSIKYYDEDYSKKIMENHKKNKESNASSDIFENMIEDLW